MCLCHLEPKHILIENPVEERVALIYTRPCSTVEKGGGEGRGKRGRERVIITGKRTNKLIYIVVFNIADHHNIHTHPYDYKYETVRYK